MACILQALRDILHVLYLTRSNLLGESLVELLVVLVVEGVHNEAVDLKLLGHDVHEVLHRCCLTVVGGNHAAFLARNLSRVFTGGNIRKVTYNEARISRRVLQRCIKSFATNVVPVTVFD